ncbi:MAG: hypothetical protein B7Z72_14925 [Gemmatimonadetes bacterium 21-71-4]|nr:MAG: hypothetical protein B7Z72_14925 [Gemmatimonadetes bacterium 21-71-4]
MGDAPAAESVPAGVRPRGGAAPVARRAAGGRPPRGRGHAAQRQRADDRIRAPVRDVQAGVAAAARRRVQGKMLLHEVYNATRDPRYEGRIAFLEDYELHIAHRLVQGVDLWLNLPRVPLEACGTSGMKAALNGVPQLGTEDGWWAEGYTGLNGWSIPAAAPDDPDPDASDAEQLFRLLEEQVVPAFFTRDAAGVPGEWVRRMKHAMRTAAERFTARRMVEQYVRDYYLPSIAGDPAGDDPPRMG